MLKLYDTHFEGDDVGDDDNDINKVDDGNEDQFMALAMSGVYW
jgi:hypothetical protein